jgi:hypothetical protein
MSHSERQQLDQSGYDCLAYIARHQVQTSNLANHPGCNTQTLQKLESLGFIEQFYSVVLPMEMARICYRITTSGMNAMNRYPGNGIRSRNGR